MPKKPRQPGSGTGKPDHDQPLFFPTAADFGAWLAEHGDSASELSVGFYKVGSGKPSMTWPESVDEALCVGWIDGVRRRIDDESYTIRFSPRRKGSIWSAVNIARVEVLIAEGRMRPAGLEAFERRIERKSRIYSYERTADPQLDEAEIALFQENDLAWQHFAAEAPGYRKKLMHWVISAKQPATRARRLAKLIGSYEAGVRLLP